MKLFANLYTKIPTAQLVEQLCLASWQITDVAENEYKVNARGVELEIEGSGEVLMFGVLQISLAEIDLWIGKLSELPISYNIDLHGDEARLIRRYQQ